MRIRIRMLICSGIKLKESNYAKWSYGEKGETI